MIRAEDVADLREGDVVRLTSDEWPGGSAIEGPLTIDSNGFLVLDHPHVPGRYWIRDNRCAPYDADARSLTVVSRAPRPLYVNSDRTEPVPGDVFVQDDGQSFPLYVVEDSDRVARHRRNGTVSWLDAGDDRLPARLRLLVDGTTGEVVP